MRTLSGAYGALALIVALPRLGCGTSREPAAGDPSVAAPSASVVQIAAGLGFCESLEVCAKECDAGSSDRCRRLGVNYEFGHGTDVDGVHATALYEQSCAMGNPEGCLSTGRMYEFHHGVAKDDAKAVSFYRRTCDLGDQAGCVNLAIMLENGRGTALDHERAAALFDGACKAGSSLACAHAKTLHPPSDAGGGRP